MANTSFKTTVDWKNIPWCKLERVVFKLQKRIYRASQRGDVRTVRKLQKMLMNSWSAKCIAVRQVTQDNQGKNTAGVDGIKTLSPIQRLTLVKNLKVRDKGKPTRRVWIPKPGTEEKRPLGIHTIDDRAVQALVKIALEPEWEANFEPNSYGFRPGRSCHDAIEAIFSSVKYKPKFVLDADIAKCFDRINHEALLKKINTFPKLRRQIKAWLKSGVMDGKQMFPTEEGTPQGGVISSLLANIALHGMEELVSQIANSLPGRKRVNQENLKLIRYADDFVVLHQDLEVVLKCKERISEWLKDMGLELKPSKTRIGHTLEKMESMEPGFNFLGFNIRQYKVGKHTSGRNTNGSTLGFKTIISPSREKVKVHIEKIGRIIRNHKAVSQETLIGKLNPIISGWANYYSTVVSKETFSYLDSLMYQKLRAWANVRHHGKSKYWIKDKYWKTIGNSKWVFASTRNGEVVMELRRYNHTPIVRHIKVKGEASPYGGNLAYWSIRKGTHPELTKRVSTLMKIQKGKCTHCGLFFKDGDLWEVDHITPKSLGGKDEYKNLQLLHRHCHDEKTASDGSIGTKSDRNRVEPKSSPVRPLGKFSHLDAHEIWRKGLNGEEMTFEEKKYFWMLSN